MANQSIKAHKQHSAQRSPRAAASRIKQHAARAKRQEAAQAAIDERKAVREQEAEEAARQAARAAAQEAAAEEQEAEDQDIPEGEEAVETEQETEGKRRFSLGGLKDKAAALKDKMSLSPLDEEDEQEQRESEDIFRLTQPRSTGFLSILFSRFFIFAILIVLQIALWVGIVIWIRNKQPVYIVVEWIFTAAMLIYLFMSEMDASAKLTWMALFALVPLPAAAMLLYTQTNFGHRTVKTRVQDLIEETRDQIEQPPHVMEALEREGGHTDDLVRWLNRSGCFPAFAGSDATYYPLGEDMFRDMLIELRSAERYIFMEYFIIEEGYMWGKILEILLEKAAAGVDVRVMYDGMCEMSTLMPGYWKKLREHGIQAKSFAPIKPILSSHYNYRDHRKILVIDGKTAFTGGVNLADEYINRTERFGHWKDTALRIKGDAAKSFALMFLQMWSIDEQEPVFDEYLDDGGYVSPYRSGCVIPYADCPLDDDKVGETVYMDILNRAGTYVHIMTPYLILDGELETALKYAAQRGVDVKIILPGIPDKKVAYALAKSHYYALRKAGVQIYEYTPGFVHAKVMVSDDVKAVVGTINMDYRSLYHHYECAAYLYKNTCIKNIELDFQATLDECELVTDEMVEGEKFAYKITAALAKVAAPLM